MLELIEETLAKLYDAMVRGICVSLTIIVVWVSVVGVMQHAAPIMKEVGIWKQKQIQKE